MMPYDTYRLYQAERVTSYAGPQRADEPAGRLASATSSLFRGIAHAAAKKRSWPHRSHVLPA